MVTGHTRLRGRLALALGSVVVVVLADLALGTFVERVWPPVVESVVESVVADSINVSGTQETVADPRAGLPAMAGSPWAEEYFREIQLTPSSYWPFTETRPESFEGEFVNIDGWERRSYVSPGVGGDAPVVWMFGGSTAWGEGQRDEFTIASYLVRIAEREGFPIVVRNFGQRGWTHFQEMILFEQLLADEPAPDVAVFYDGANEINAQSLGAKGVPSHTLADQYAELISGGFADEFATEEPAPSPGAVGAAWDAYTETSAVRQAVDWLRASFVAPAGASESTRGRSAGDADPDSRETQQLEYLKTISDAQRAIGVYERGRDLTISLAELHEVQPLFFWQPVTVGAPELWAIDHLSDPTVDISDSLDARMDVYIDGGHTNEEGASLVAERIWVDLERQLRRIQPEE